MASPPTLARSSTGPPTLARSSTGRTLPNHEDLQPYNFAVAGHDGTLCDPDGELFIKPCTQQEIDFYETAFKDHVDFAELMPVYLGTLSLNDATDITSLNEQLPVVADHMSQHMKEQAVRMAREAAAEAAAAAAPVPDGIAWNPNKNRKIATNKSVVLENAAYGFTRPNILDAKLGKRLWADDAPLEKRRRFDEISKATTNGSHGFRIAGMRVYKGSTDPSEWDAEGYKVYDKDYGRFTVTKDNIVQEMRKFIFNEQAGIDEDLGRAIAQAFVNDLKQVERVLSREESRMYSASLLFTFEGDGEVLRAAIAAQSPPTGAKSTKEKKGEDGNGALLLASRVDSGIVLDDEGEIVLGPGKEHPTLGTIGEHTTPGGLIEGDLKVHELTSGGQTEATSEDDEEDELSSLPRIYSLKLIDFAHASWVPGQGPDENNLFGVRSLIRIFEELAQ